MRRYAVASLVLATTGPSNEHGDGMMHMEIPNDPGRVTPVRRPDFDAMAKPDSEPMAFEQALLFAKAGRRIARRGWDEMPFGGLVVHDGQLQWELDATMHVMIPSLDLLARDWIVL